MLRDLLGPARQQDRLVELIREWIDEHHGRRPTALELSVVTGQAFQLKAKGGWFGFLAELGVLDPAERRVFEQVRDFLIWIEHGNYSKSYKLITLQALDQLNGLRSGASVRDVAATSRWMIFRDNDLLADLADAGSYFDDITRPTSSEWDSYWRRNPIQAITSATRGQQPWFAEDDGLLVPQVSVDDEVGETFEAMVREVTEFRLHRYLTSQAARRVGEVRRPIEDGVEVDATFSVETTGTTPTSVIIESAGGTAGTKDARNTEYVRGFDLVLQRLAGIGAQLVDAYIDTRRTAGLTVSDRRLGPGEGLSYPVPMAAGVDLEDMRRSMLRSMAKAGRTSGTKGGGNARKRARLIVHVPAQWTAASLADALANGHRMADADGGRAASQAFD